MLDQTTQPISNGIKLSVLDIPQPEKRHRFVCPSRSDVKKDKQKEKGTPQPKYLTMFSAEVLGTALLMFLGCMGCISQVDNPVPSHHMTSLAFGLVIMLIIQLFGHISGAHLNPAVTIATVIMKMLTPTMGVVYIVAQFVGATIGFSALKMLTPEEYTTNGFCVTKPHEKITVAQGFLIEVIITTLLILICCAIWDKRNSHKEDSIPLRFGFIIVAISMVAGPFTGASMNTARSLAPVLFDRNWENQWIYFIGPNIAAVIGCGIYNFLFAEKKEEETDAENIHLEDTAHNISEKV